jgi:rRNA maturation endonuclease Nob1
VPCFSIDFSVGIFRKDMGVNSKQSLRNGIEKHSAHWTKRCTEFKLFGKIDT